MKMRIQDEGSRTPADDAFYGGNFESILLYNSNNCVKYIVLYCICMCVYIILLQKDSYIYFKCIIFGYTLRKVSTNVIFLETKQNKCVIVCIQFLKK